MPIEIRWTVSHSASCVYAADLLRRGRSIVDRRLADAVADPAGKLIEEVNVAGLPVDRIWRHLLPLSARIESNHQLVETVLKKTMGADYSIGSITERLAGRIADLEAAAANAFPALLDEVSVGVPHLTEPWNVRGAALLQSIGRLTDERLVDSGAEVSLVYPSGGGGGVANLLYNSAIVEAVAADPVPQLPELLRLSWLLSQLNIDVPIFSENIIMDHRPLVASLAMLPATLAAAERVELARCDPATISMSLQSWHVVGPAGIDLSDVVISWWETYASSRPAWNVALSALEQMVWPFSARPAAR